jgi:hypothetical protein
MTQSVKPIWNLYVKSYYLAIIIATVSLLIGWPTGNQLCCDVFKLSSTYLSAPLILCTHTPTPLLLLGAILLSYELSESSQGRTK